MPEGDDDLIGDVPQISEEDLDEVTTYVEDRGVANGVTQQDEVVPEHAPFTPEEIDVLLHTLKEEFPNAIRVLAHHLGICADRSESISHVCGVSAQELERESSVGRLLSLDDDEDLDFFSTTAAIDKTTRIESLRKAETLSAKIADFLRKKIPTIKSAANVAETSAAVIEQLKTEHAATLATLEEQIAHLTSQLQQSQATIVETHTAWQQERAQFIQHMRVMRHTARQEYANELRPSLLRAREYYAQNARADAQAIRERDQEIQRLRAELAAANSTIQELRRNEEPAAGTAAKRPRLDM